MISWPGRVILLDIEGTVSEIVFVHDVLFPYARKNVRSFIHRNQTVPAVRVVLDRMAQDSGFPDLVTWCPLPLGTEASVDWLVTRVESWMNQDAKLTGLKALQGLIWEQGYHDGTLKSHLFSEVPACLHAWVQALRTVAIYSSGSVAAQKLLFAHTQYGDITPYISTYFDTTSGGKRESASYGRIAEQLGQPESEILFLSDVPEELAAATDAGMSTALVVRPGNRPTDEQRFARIASLEEVRLIDRVQPD